MKNTNFRTKKIPLTIPQKKPENYALICLDLAKQSIVIFFIPLRQTHIVSTDEKIRLRLRKDGLNWCGTVQQIASTEYPKENKPTKSLFTLTAKGYYPLFGYISSIILNWNTYVAILCRDKKVHVEAKRRHCFPGFSHQCLLSVISYTSKLNQLMRGRVWLKKLQNQAMFNCRVSFLV